MKTRLFILAAIIALTLMALSLPASAAMQYQSTDVTVTFHDGPCTEAGIAQILSLVAPGESKAATVVVGGEPIPACYVDQGDKMVLVDALGNGGYLPSADLKQLPTPMTAQPAPA